MGGGARNSFRFNTRQPAAPNHINALKHAALKRNEFRAPSRQPAELDDPSTVPTRLNEARQNPIDAPVDFDSIPAC